MLLQKISALLILGIVHTLPDFLLDNDYSNLKHDIDRKDQIDNEDRFLASNWFFPFVFHNFNQQNSQENFRNQFQSSSLQNELPEKLFLNHQPVDSMTNIIQPSIMNIVPIPLKNQFFPFPIIKPYVIQQPTITASGKVVIENLLGGIPFKCTGRPSGHYRDDYICDVFHACVHGQQQKTYSCPFVGEAQYFDDITQKCEFVKENLFGCSTKIFYY